MYDTKFPRGRILISDEDAQMLENMMAKNEKRTRLTVKEKALLEGSKKFDPASIIKNL